MPSVRRIAVTGGAGQIAYSLLFRIASGEMLGPQQPVSLRVLELDAMLGALNGVKMELEDCAFPLLEEVVVSSDPRVVFEGVDIALLVGAKPRSAGMERKDLLGENGKIFVAQGQALNDVADQNVKVLVVGNPCNTNCLIAMHNAPRLDPQNFYAMMRLDQHRAASFLAQKAGVPITKVSNMIIWGNHSSTQVPDFYHAKIDGKPAAEVIKDTQWLETEFISNVQKRGAAIINARGKSSAASAAHAVIESVKTLIAPGKSNDWFSLGVHSKGNPYGIDENLIFSFPCRSAGDGGYEVVGNVNWNEWLEKKIRASEQELLEERRLVESFIKVGARHG